MTRVAIKNFIFYLILLLLMTGIESAMAQPGGGGNPCPGGPPCNPDVPITGIEYLIGGGVLIGARALLRKMKRKGD